MVICKPQVAVVKPENPRDRTPHLPGSFKQNSGGYDWGDTA
ncbi:hypothetical protein LCGC14_0510100 [marine sediment metagenome]|uniref:Uncharacterized protein n=1 Tax=marine sediment metagenome TaxID=412755 RepID=A0A0F9S671_9ZZZZ